MTPGEIRVRGISGVPRVRPGDDLGPLLAEAITRSGEVLRGGDVVVVAQKVVSKAEGRIVRLADVVPSPRAIELAARVDKDARAVEVILGESVEVLRAVPGVLIVETRHGIILANAGADMSNIEHDAEDDHLLLLPEDPDASADRLRAALAAGAAESPRIGIVVADSVGRAWREGTVGLAIGVSGLPARLDRRGEPDLFGRALHVTEVGIADSIASAASIVMGEGAEGRPAALVRGLSFEDRNEAERAGRAGQLVRPRERDLFR